MMIPELTDTQKNEVLLMQRQILTLQTNIFQAQKQLESFGPTLTQLLNKIVLEMELNPEHVVFDLDNLVVVAKPVEKTKEAVA
jgi:hypothetical protein